MIEIKKSSLKMPDVPACPCCGHPTVSKPTNNPTALHARPECGDQQTDSMGALVSWRLYWHCQICGCRWKNNQILPASAESAIALGSLTMHTKET
jgi:ribosomal protein L37AE/L43A